MSFYPAKIQTRFDSPLNAGTVDGASAVGSSASFQCGSFVAFSLRVDPAAKAISDVSFRSNGCGYMIAAADFLADIVNGRPLSELHGLNNDDLNSKVAAEFGLFPCDRRQCVDVCINALRLYVDHFLNEHAARTASTTSIAGPSNLVHRFERHRVNT